jgi:hypothetical protein
MGVIKALITMAFGFSIVAFGIAAGTAAKMADPNAWQNEVLAMGHVILLGLIGSGLISEGWQSLKSAQAGPAKGTKEKRRTSAGRS